MKATRHKIFMLIGFIAILCLCIVGVLNIQKGAAFAFADANNEKKTDLVENNNLDIIDYNGNKVEATYEFIKINETECSVRATNKTDVTTALIPDVGIIDGKEYVVTEVAANAFTSSSKLQVLKLSNTIKKVGNMAFANCNNLQFVDLKVVEELGNSVFYRCTKLKEIVIPKTVKNVGTYVFRNNNTKIEARGAESSCANWNSLWNSYNENQDVTYNSKHQPKMQAEYIYDSMSRSTDSIKGIMIVFGQPNINNFDLIDYSEFFINDTIIIPKEYKTVDGKIYPVLGIAGYAFSMSSFKNLIIEYSEVPIEIGCNAFDFTESIENQMNVIFNRRVIYNDYESGSSNNIFLDSKLKNIILPSDCGIADSMFAGCGELENIFFEPIRDYAIEGKNEITELQNRLKELIKTQEGIVDINENVQSIGNNAFENTTAIKELHLTDKIKNVGQNIIADWDKDKQKVFVHNSLPINYKKDPNSDGWHPQWSMDFNVKYDLNYHKIFFDAGDYTINYINENNYIDVIEGQKIGTLPTVQIKDYEIFNGWYLDETQYTSETFYEHTEDIILKAKVENVVCTIKFDKDGGVGGTNEVEAQYGNDMPQAQQPTKAGWKFNGYFSEKNGRGIKYYDGTDKANGFMYSVNVSNFIIDSTIYADWTDYQTIIKYDLAGGKNNSDNPVSVRSSDKAITLKDATKDGYVFEGWYLDGVRITSLYQRTEKEILLVAKWASCLDAPVTTIDSSASTIILTGRSVYRIKLPRSNQVMRFEIYSDVKQVYIFSESYRE